MQCSLGELAGVRHHVVVKDIEGGPLTGYEEEDDMKDSREAPPPWVKPELTIMVRYTPEEAVLNSCKNGEWTGPAGPQIGNNECLLSAGCGTCDAITAS